MLTARMGCEPIPQLLVLAQRVLAEPPCNSTHIRQSFPGALCVCARSTHKPSCVGSQVASKVITALWKCEVLLHIGIARHSTAQHSA